MKHYKITYDAGLHFEVEVVSDCVENALSEFYEKYDCIEVFSVIRFYPKLGIF